MSDLIQQLPHHQLVAQRYREYSRQRQYGTGDSLLDNRIIFLGLAGSQFLGNDINDLTATAVIQQLLYLQYENRNQEIHLYINSPGGMVSSMLAIYDTMQFLECPVVTYCMGMAASAAAVAGRCPELLPPAPPSPEPPSPELGSAAWLHVQVGGASPPEGAHVLLLVRLVGLLLVALVGPTGQALASGG